MSQDDYFVMESANNDDYPLFAWDQTSPGIIKGVPAVVNAPLSARLGDPISPHYKLVDYHVMPEPVISQLIKAVLDAAHIEGIQLLPIALRLPKEKSPMLDKYWLLHVVNKIACLDKTKSEVEYSKSGETIFGIEKLALDETVLKNIPIHKRLIFVLSENVSVYLIHKTIKEKILEKKPVGLRFFKVTEWNSDLVFE